MCDDVLWIWWINFGALGAKNDLQIFNQSKLFNKIRTGMWPPSLPEIDVAGYPLTWFYFLVDGIYPRLRFLISSCASPTTGSEKMFARHQESARKAVERVFGVLFKRFALLYRPSRLWFESDMEKIVKASFIIRNMCVEIRRPKYQGTMPCRLPDDFSLPSDLTFLKEPREHEARAEFCRTHLKGIENAKEHCELKCALVKHIWARTGDIVQESSGVVSL
jgi:Plant transposon protein